MYYPLLTGFKNKKPPERGELKWLSEGEKNEEDTNYIKRRF